MAEQLRLDLVTPQRHVLCEDVDEVRLPGVLGELGVLPGHTPLLSSLGTGPLTYFRGGEQHQFAVQGGFVEVLPDSVTVLARTAEAPGEIDVNAARTQLSDAEAKLPTAAAEEIEELTADVQLATTRLEVGGHGPS